LCLSFVPERLLFTCIHLLSVVILLIPAGQVPAKARVVDAVVARVNGEAVLYSHLRRDMLIERMNPGYSFNDPISREHYKRLLTRRIDELLLMQFAELEDVRVEESELAREVVKSLKNLENRFGSEQSFLDYLELNGMKMQSLRSMLTRQERTRSMAARIVGRSVHLDQKELEAFRNRRTEALQPLEEIELAQVMISCSRSQLATPTGEKLKSRAFDISQLLAGSRDSIFRILKSAPQDRDPSRQVDYLGWMDPQDLMPELRQAAEGLNPGDVSIPILTDRGYHILYLLDRRSDYDLLYAEKFREARLRRLEQLREEADIRIYRDIEPELSP
jgi:peptidyl-prolyl cis-trans isomerase SurA